MTNNFYHGGGHFGHSQKWLRQIALSELERAEFRKVANTKFCIGSQNPHNFDPTPHLLCDREEEFIFTWQRSVKFYEVFLPLALVFPRREGEALPGSVNFFNWYKWGPPPRSTTTREKVSHNYYKLVPFFQDLILKRKSKLLKASSENGIFPSSHFCRLVPKFSPAIHLFGVGSISRFFMVVQGERERETHLKRRRNRRKNNP